MLIITRFHDVLFQTERFYEALWESLFRDDLSKKEWMDAYQETLHHQRHFDLRHFLKRVSQMSALSMFDLRGRMNHALDDLSLQEYVYEDWFSMKKHISSSCTTVVFVGLIFGDVKFEKKLLERTGLKKVFDDIFYAILKPTEVLDDIVKKYPRERVYYIDTALHHITDIQKQFPEVSTIAVNRNDDPRLQQCRVEQCVRDFQEAGEYIMSEWSLG